MTFSRLVFVIIVLAAGCNRAKSGYNATVQGAVTIDGELAPKGTVTFYPVKKGPVAVGTVAKDGSYSLRIGQGNASNIDQSGVPSGEYIATVVVTGPSEKNTTVEGGPPSVGPRLMADKYASRDTSDLKITVKPGPNVIALSLDGPSANPPKDEAAEDKKTTDPKDDGKAAEQPTEGNPSPGASLEKQPAEQTPATAPAGSEKKDSNTAPAPSSAENDADAPKAASEESTS